MSGEGVAPWLLDKGGKKVHGLRLQDEMERLYQRLDALESAASDPDVPLDRMLGFAHDFQDANIGANTAVDIGPLVSFTARNSKARIITQFQFQPGGEAASTTAAVHVSSQIHYGPTSALGTIRIMEDVGPFDAADRTPIPVHAVLELDDLVKGRTYFARARYGIVNSPFTARVRGSVFVLVFG